MDAPDRDKLERRNALVEANRGLVIRIAKSMWRQRSRVRGLGDLDDVIQIGQLALIAAAQNYDTEHHSGCGFCHYAYVSIYKTIVRTAYERGGQIRVPNSTMTDPKGNAAHLARRELVRRAFGCGCRENLNQEPAPRRIEEDFPLDVADVPDLMLVLDERSAQTVRLYYGIGDGRPLTYEGVGERLGISRERVRQILSRAMERLKSRAYALTGVHS